MSGFQIRISSADCARVAAALNRAAERIEDTRPLLYQIKEYGLRSHLSRFAAGRTPDGKSMARNADSTRYLKGHDRPLQEKGRLYLSIRGYIRAPRRVVIGTDDFRGPLHQYGYTTSEQSMIPGEKVPARPFIGWSREDRSAIERMCRAFVSSRIP